MSGSKIFVDTNILIYLLQGDLTITEILEGKELFISVITELELQTIPNLSSSQLNSIKQLIADCQIIGLLEGVKSKAIEIRKFEKLKLPDAIIAASAAHCIMPLFTADKGFKKLSSVDVVLYESSE